MDKHVIIIGAVALGPKVACRLRRINPDVKITVIDRDSHISYGGCGIPYYIGGDVNDIEGLQSTQSHTIRDAHFFKAVKGVDVLTRVEATEIDRRGRKLTVKNLDTGVEKVLDYDKLVIATGATPIKPPIPGIDLPTVNIVSNLHHAEEIKGRMTKGQVSKAVVIGAGAIGIEMAEAMTDLWGIETTLVEMADQVLPAALGRNMAAVVQKQMEEHGVRVLVSERVTEIKENKENGTTVVVLGNEEIECDMVVLSTGIRPNTQFASEAGLAIGQFGGLIVDRRLRTNDPNIYAGGDCVEVRNLLSGNNQMMPLGSLANRQGRVIADNINGGHALFRGTVGTFCIKVFDMGVATSGLTFNQAKAAGFNPAMSLITQADRAHFYPTSKAMYAALIADRNSRQVLGIECVGAMGDAVKARVDAVASVLRFGVDVDDISKIEGGYAPPYASAMDVVNNVGNVLDNILDGRNIVTEPVQFLEEWNGNPDSMILDVRDAVQAEPYLEKYSERWLHIPQSELGMRFGEVPQGKKVFIVCDTGTRSYEGQIVLRSKGIENTFNVQGGLSLVKINDPNFI
ncbi:FAD-dependent oxidoreductase [Desulfosediminicola sp.]|uniref:FAD-dependent oxidoreductase n=1 Tax=Desulfosediminicola sp. TaxID=2886825 RepID=UPI003AF1E775